MTQCPSDKILQQDGTCREHVGGSIVSVGEFGITRSSQGFILAYHVTKKVVKEKGATSFLQQSDFYSGIYDDFTNTPKGVKKDMGNQVKIQ